MPKTLNLQHKIILNDSKAFFKNLIEGATFLITLIAKT